MLYSDTQCVFFVSVMSYALKYAPAAEYLTSLTPSYFTHVQSESPLWWEKEEQAAAQREAQQELKERNGGGLVNYEYGTTIP